MVKYVEGSVVIRSPASKGPSPLVGIPHVIDPLLSYLAEATTSRSCWNSSWERAVPMLGTDMLALWRRWRSGVGFDCASAVAGWERQ